MFTFVKNMSINKRVQIIIEKTSTTKAAFSEATGISTVILSHISSGRNKVSLTAVEQILRAFPAIRAEWLILGKGQMFNSSNNIQLIDEIEEVVLQLNQEVDLVHKQLTQKLSETTKFLDKMKQS